jgi:hypothetical protein
MSEKNYNADYYRWRESPAKKSAEIIVPILREMFPTESVVDIGCAEGTWLSVFQTNGTKKIFGYDGPWLDHEKLVITNESFKKCCLDTFRVDPGTRYELAICLEVAEHLNESSADNLVLQLTNLADRVLFSAAIPGQGGLHHINEQPPEYWKRKFNRLGFRQKDTLRPIIWNDDRIAWWYRQNIFIYEKSTESENCLHDSWQGNYLVHPEAFRDKLIEMDIDNISVRNLCKALLRKIVKS